MLERIAAALERIAPQHRPPVDWSVAPAFLWDGTAGREVAALGALPLDQLRGIEEQKRVVFANIERLAHGHAAHDMLLWGSRGMGKSALIRSCVAAVQAISPAAIGLIQVQAGSLASFPVLIEQMRSESRAFLVFVDDLSFDGDDTGSTLELRSALDGGIVARPPNIRLAVTSNRRSLVERDASDADALHERDERDHALALADRFGLTVGFHPCDRATYLEILRAYTDSLGLDVDEEEALAWAIGKGNRSGRTAYQFACELAGRANLSF